MHQYGIKQPNHKCRKEILDCQLSYSVFFVNESNRLYYKLNMLLSLKSFVWKKQQNHARRHLLVNALILYSVKDFKDSLLQLCAECYFKDGALVWKKWQDHVKEILTCQHISFSFLWWTETTCYLTTVCWIIDLERLRSEYF